MSDLAARDANHEWLWMIDANKGVALTPDDYVAAVIMRLLAAGTETSAFCGNCGSVPIGTSGTHCLLCARGQSTTGHNKVRDVLFKACSQTEPSTEIEPVGLILSRPLLRPADVLTGASGLTGCLAALDVGICSPNARGAGDDCLQSMLNRKNDRMKPFETELDQAGVQYKPIIFSCYGRPHDDAIKMVSSLARRIARCVLASLALCAIATSAVTSAGAT